MNTNLINSPLVNETNLSNSVVEANNRMKTGIESNLDDNAKSLSESINGAELLDSIVEVIDRFTILPDESVIASSLWVVFSWLHDQATVSPILNINSPEKRCGKSTLLNVLNKLCSKPLVASNISSAAMYRAIGKWQPTLVIDEADTFLSKSDDLRGILNAGHYKDNAFVIRCDGTENEPVRFSTWCPKIIAGIGNLPETVMDRSIVIEMRRKLPGQKTESIRHAGEDIFTALCQKLTRWSKDNARKFQSFRPENMPEINDRAQDNWEPLIAIADIAGDSWPEKARKASLKLSLVDDEDPSIIEELLQDIIEAFSIENTNRIYTSRLLFLLCKDEEKPWATWDRGKQMTPRQLSQKLKPFKIRSGSIRTGGVVKRGYYFSDVQEVASRYLPQNSATEATEATKVADVADVTL